MDYPRPSLERPTTLVPAFTFAQDIGVVLAGASLTALAAQIAIPFKPVPLTMQTLAVMLCGLALGARRGALSQLAYLAAGAAGLPVFANWQGGSVHLFQDTGGYLVGFVAAAWLLGWLAERGWDRKALSCAAAMALGVLTILVPGTAWLTVFYGLPAAVMTGFLPFLGVEAVKCLVVALTLPFIRSLVPSSSRKTPRHSRALLPWW